MHNFAHRAQFCTIVHNCAHCVQLCTMINIVHISIEMCNFKYRGCIQPSSHLIVLLIHLLLRSRLCTFHIDIVQHIKILQISILQMNNEHTIVVQSANCTSSLRATILSLTAHCADQKCEHCADQQCEQCKVHNAHLNSEQSAEMIWCAVCIDPCQDRIQGGAGGGGGQPVATTGQLGHPGKATLVRIQGEAGGGAWPVATTCQLGHPGKDQTPVRTCVTRSHC